MGWRRLVASEKYSEIVTHDSTEDLECQASRAVNKGRLNRPFKTSYAFGQ